MIGTFNLVFSDYSTKNKTMDDIKEFQKTFHVLTNGEIVFSGSSDEVDFSTKRKLYLGGKDVS